MGSYLISVAVMSAIAGLLSYVSYPSGVDKASKLALSLLLLYVTAMPVMSFAGGLSDFDFEGFMEEVKIPSGELSEEYIEVAEEAFVHGVRRLVADKYDLDEENVEVYVTGFDFESMKAKKIKITLSGMAALADYRGIENYVEKCGLGECEVNIELG